MKELKLPEFVVPVCPDCGKSENVIAEDVEITVTAEVDMHSLQMEITDIGMRDFYFIDDFYCNDCGCCWTDKTNYDNYSKASEKRIKEIKEMWAK